jgi:hypothetical protein
MPSDSGGGFGDAHRLRHDLVSALTIICGQTQLLQRRLGRMDGLADGDRQRLEAGLAMILTAARALDATIAELPTIHEEREAS